MYSTNFSLNITWRTLASRPQWIFYLISQADTHYGAPPEPLKAAYLHILWKLIFGTSNVNVFMTLNTPKISCWKLAKQRSLERFIQLRERQFSIRQTESHRNTFSEPFGNFTLEAAAAWVPHFLGSALWLGSIRQRRLKCLSGQRDRGTEGGREGGIGATYSSLTLGNSDGRTDDHKSSRN